MSVKCSDCGYCGSGYLKGHDGQGVYRVSTCVFDVHDVRLVDPDVERECKHYTTALPKPDVLAELSIVGRHDNE